MQILPWLHLTLAPRLSNSRQLALLEAFGSPEQVFTMPRAEVVARLGEEVASALDFPAPAQAVESTLLWLEHPDHHFLGIGEPGYPQALMQIAAPPAALYVRGRLDLLGAPAVSVVGSRNATAQGVRDAESFARALSEAGLAIVSGLALGVDAAAHRGGLGGRGSTIGVLGTGANRIYPARNADLAHEIADRGALVSEFPLDTPPVAGNFPRRNRLISGLSRGVLVVEAALESGSLITARYALEQNRDVFAIPGSIHSPLSKGCHRLIKDGAKLVESADDILDELRIAHRCDAAQIPERREPHDPVLDAMGSAPVSIDAIAERMRGSVGAIAAHISALEIEGHVAPVPGGLFQRVHLP